MRRRRYSRRTRPRALGRALVRAIALIALAACVYAAGRAARPHGAPPAATAEAVETRSVVLDAYTFYAIQFGAFDNESDARALSESYVSRGAAGYVLTDTRSRAIGAAYAARADADAVCANLSAQGIDAYVYAVSAPRVELRVTAGGALIEAISAAHAQTLEAIAALSELALALDRGDIAPNAALAELAEVRARSDAAREALETELAGRTHAATAGLISELHADADACAALMQQNTDSAMAFSGKMKYNVIDLMQRHVQFLQMLIQPAASA